MNKENCGTIVDYQKMEMLLSFSIAKVRSSLQDKHKFPIPKDCDAYLARCIRLKDGDMDKAIKLVLANRDAITNIHGWGVKMQPRLYKGLFDSTYIMPLIDRDSLGRRIIVFRIEFWDPQEFNFEQTYSFLWMLTQLLHMKDIDTQRRGLVFVFDFTNISAKHLIACSPKKILSIAKWATATNGVMGRLKELHGINHPNVINLLYKTLKPFLKEKLTNRIMFHGSLGKLHEHVDPENLPNFLGGKLDNEKCINQQWIEKVYEYENHFSNEIMESGIFKE